MRTFMTPRSLLVTLLLALGALGALALLPAEGALLAAVLAPPAVSGALARKIKAGLMTPAMARMYRQIAEKWGDRTAQNMNRAPLAATLASLVPGWDFVNDIDAFAAEFATKYREVVRWAFYSYRTYAAAGQNQLIHFQQTASAATNGKGDTNMKVAGAMDGGNSFLVMGVHVTPIPGLADLAVANGPSLALQQWHEVLRRNTWLEFKIGDKVYVDAGPLTLFPESSGLGGFYTAGAAAATTTNIGIPQNGTPDNLAMWRQDPPILILPTRSFVVTTNWLALTTVTTVGKLGVTLSGLLLRTIQ